jgi:glucosylceramidase
MKREFIKLRFIFVLIILLTVKLAGAQRATPFSMKHKTVKVYTTTKSTNDRLTPTGTLQFSDKPQPVETDFAIFVDPSKTFQTMLGIGGALTDASAEIFYKLPKDKQKELLTAYYDKDKGIGYTLGRTNIQSCDFSSSSYSYVKDNDAALKTFDVSHDKQYRIPFIKEIMKAAGGN